MTIIDGMNLRCLDLNLQAVLDTLMREPNVTHAAERVGLSQPAFSNALRSSAYWTRAAIGLEFRDGSTQPAAI
jgi:Bacterial regulatory helix-turn-helix protein, lysR family